MYNTHDATEKIFLHILAFFVLSRNHYLINGRNIHALSNGIIFYSSDGIVLIEVWIAFASDAMLPIRPLNLAVKRGRLKHLAIEMDGYQVTQVAGMFTFLT